MVTCQPIVENRNPPSADAILTWIRSLSREWQVVCNTRLKRYQNINNVSQEFQQGGVLILNKDMISLRTASTNGPHNFISSPRAIQLINCNWPAVTGYVKVWQLVDHRKTFFVSASAAPVLPQQPKPIHYVKYTLVSSVPSPKKAQQTLHNCLYFTTKV